MKKTFALLIISAFLVISCKKTKISNSDLLTQVASIKGAKSARGLALSDQLIDLDTAISRHFGADDMDQLTKAKAAVYRFYKHVSVVNDEYVTDLKSGAQIHVSSAVYVLLKDNLDQMNKDATAMKKKGKAVQMVTPDSAYFDQLLN